MVEESDLETILDAVEFNLGKMRETSDCHAQQRADILTTKALGLAPNNDRAHFLRGFYEYRMGLEEHDADKRRELYAKAISHYEAAIDINPRNAMYHGNKGYVLFLEGDYTTAEVALKEASVLNVDEPMYDHLLGFIYEIEDKLSQALVAYERAASKYRHLETERQLTKDQQPYAAHIVEDIRRCRSKIPSMSWPMGDGRIHIMGSTFTP